MNTRSKLVAAVIGLVFAAGAIGDVSAKTATKTVTSHAVAAKTTKSVAHKTVRLRAHVGKRIVRTPTVAVRTIRHVRIVHRALPIAAKKIVRVSKPMLFQKQAFAHRLIVKKTVVR